MRRSAHRPGDWPEDAGPRRTAAGRPLSPGVRDEGTGGLGPRALRHRRRRLGARRTWNAGIKKTRGTHGEHPGLGTPGGKRAEFSRRRYAPRVGVAGVAVCSPADSSESERAGVAGAGAVAAKAARTRDHGAHCRWRSAALGGGRRDGGGSGRWRARNRAMKRRASTSRGDECVPSTSANVRGPRYLRRTSWSRRNPRLYTTFLKASASRSKHLLS